MMKSKEDDEQTAQGHLSGMDANWQNGCKMSFFDLVFFFLLLCFVFSTSSAS